MRMPGGWLHRSCDSLARSVLPSCWVLAAIFFVFLSVFSSLRAVRHRCRRFRELFFVFSVCFFEGLVHMPRNTVNSISASFEPSGPTSSPSDESARQPHQIPLLRLPLPRRPLRSQSQRRLRLRPSPRLFNSRYLRCWRPFGRTERQILPAVRQAIPARPPSRPARRRLIHRLRLRVVHRL